jgi:hypothetical protein
VDLTDINAVPDAFDERGLPVIHLARVIEYDVPDSEGNGAGELIVLLSTITDPGRSSLHKTRCGPIQDRVVLLPTCSNYCLSVRCAFARLVDPA